LVNVLAAQLANHAFAGNFFLPVQYGKLIAVAVKGT
jgi:hypothetical protein